MILIAQGNIQDEGIDSQKILHMYVDLMQLELFY